jgi:signal transduction histidine kinase
MQARADAQRRALQRFCAHDYLIDRTLLQLETAQLNEQARAELSSVLPDVRDALGFDVLALVRSDGVVLASAHYPGQAGSRDAETWHIASSQHARSGWVRRIRIRGERGPTDRLVLESACTRRRGNATVAVAGGVAVDEALVREIASDDTVTARLMTTPVVPDTRGITRRVLPLPGPDGTPAAWVVIETSDDDLKALIRDVDTFMLAGVLLAALVAVLLAVLLALALARPMAVVAAAAERIAAGERDVHIEMRARGEVGHLVAAFNHMTAQLGAADARLRRAVRMGAWRDIARQMAHEIKNPLTPIRLAVEMLRKAKERQMPDFDEMFDEETRIVLDEVERLRRLVEDFSRFARAPKPRPELFSLAEVLSQVAGLHAGSDTPVQWSIDEEGGTFPLLRADRDQLTQVLVNLVANACHAAAERAARDPSRGPARVSIVASRVGDGFAHIAVDDNGGGIAPEVMERLFEPYVTNKQGGTGLGLAIAYRIVTDHGGTLVAESSPTGTRFIARLPFAGPGAMDTVTSPETGVV